MSDNEHPEHVEHQTPSDQQTPAAQPEHAGHGDTDRITSIIEDWADDYPPGTELFCARFEPDDFDVAWGDDDYPEGATVAIRRGEGMPSQGWILKNAHLTDMERSKKIIEKFASPDALRILYDLEDSVFLDFTEAWGKDGGMQPGKSNRSARRSARKRRR